MNEDVFVPFVVFGALAAIIISAFFFSYKKRLVVYDAIKVAIEKTGSVDPALVEAIIRDNVGPYADLRKGIILIAVAAAFVALGAAIPEDDVFRPMLGIASFPGLVGLAYVGFHFFAPREATV
ncbi:hypothetical protein [Hyphococcus sp.]|uniref:hypothetical protein n=1 Tax=Hyphococcus sp. TaxID=2038636 RepID=UPI002089878B|nr:MAG: hypothetical protein DHS20C04_16730 [Marinicaulis sp.]